MPVASRKRRGVGADGKKKRARTTGVLPVRSAARAARPSNVEDFFGEGSTGNLLRGCFTGDPEVYAWFQKRHSKGLKFLDKDGYYERNDHRWKVPYGVRDALHQPLMAVQITTKYPFFVTWVSPKTGKRLRKLFMSLPHAIVFVAERAQYVDEDAAIVARHGFDIPTKLRGKFPRKMDGRMHYWCPRCMSPRRFRKTDSVFFADKKFWNEEKGHYEWKNVKLAVVECTVCGITNRDYKFRRSNQPFEKRKIKKGVRRVKRRKR